jgi:hypothetical protein
MKIYFLGKGNGLRGGIVIVLPPEVTILLPVLGGGTFF